jgi:hypothetical protein
MKVFISITQLVGGLEYVQGVSQTKELARLPMCAYVYCSACMQRLFGASQIIISHYNNLVFSKT